MGLFGSLAFGALSLGVVVFWWAAKRVAVSADSATIWDASDLIFGALGGVTWLVYLLLNPLVSAYSGVGLYVIHASGTGVYAYSVTFWMASIAMEKKGFAVPESMAPIEDRIYEQFSWIPGWRRYMIRGQNA